MAELTDTMAKGLRKVADGNCQTVHGRTINALRSRSLVKPAGNGTYEITPSGRFILDAIERSDREQAERLERLSRPVPASAFVEPSARNPVVMAEDMGNGCDCDRDGCRVCFPVPAVPEPATPEASAGLRYACFRDHQHYPHCLPEPAVPQSWVDQLLALLDRGVRVEWDGQGWRAHPVPFTMPSDRLSATVAHAIASGVVRPTTGLREPVRLVRVPERAVAATGCDQCSVEPGEKHRYAGCPGNGAY